ncbi:MAG: LysR substrate-binding domain-containing protein [Gammaproteobacteria bacterium]|nr:LysR substrate-binding domain-containing protein [Gammaproteobacteria bacterium]
MTLTELRYIVAVARHLHFGHAATTCHVSQPTLSLGIKKLEEELGVEIFERGARNEIRITSLGERIIEQAQKTLEEADNVKHIAQQNQDPLSSPLKLGVIYTIAPYLLPELIPRIHKRAPNMPLLIEENYTASLTEQLKQGKIDVIIIALPFDLPGVVTQTLYEEPFIVAAPNTAEWRKRKTISTQELALENLLLLGPGNCFRDQILQSCPDCRTSGNMQQTLQGSSLETIRHMVATGAGITVLPSSANRKSSESKLLTMIPFKKPAPSRKIALAWRKSFTRPEAIEALRKEILQCQLRNVTLLKNETIRF